MKTEKAEKSEKTVELTFTYTQQEYVQAARQHLRGNNTIRKYDPIILAVTAILSFGYLFTTSFNVLSIVLVSIFLLVSGMGCFLYFIQPLLGYKKATKYHEEYTMLFRRDAIIWKTAGIESEIKWDVYKAIWQSEDFYFLVQSPRIYALIPRRAFSGAEDERAFEKMARTNQKNIKRLK